MPLNMAFSSSWKAEPSAAAIPTSPTLLPPPPPPGLNVVKLVLTANKTSLNLGE
jgi:hypothetical protein